MNLQSSAFKTGQPIPKKHTGKGQDLSPPLTWSDPPAAAKQFALIVDDPDAPTPQPWGHWVLYNIPPETTQLPEALPQKDTLDTPPGARQGKNSWDTNNIGYRGPMPPPGHGTHHYHFMLYALDTPLDAKPGLSKTQLLDLMKGHIIAQAELVGTCER